MKVKNKLYKIVKQQLDEEEELTEPICKVWPVCHHPEICLEECYDKDLKQLSELNDDGGNK